MIDDDRLRALRQLKKPDPPVRASDAQKRYIAILIEGREVPRPWVERIKMYEEQEHGILKDKASEIIGALKGLPKKNDPKAILEDRESLFPTHEDVPAGRYAIQTGDGGNDLTFYHVRRPYKDRLHIFFVAIIGGPNRYPVSHQQARAIIKNIYRIGAGDAAIRYGREVKRCSVCHTQITNRVSRELGIGPVCGGRFFPDWQERVNTVRRELDALGFDPEENVIE